MVESLISGSLLYLLFKAMQIVNLSYNFRRVLILISSVAVAIFPLINITSGIVPQFGINLEPAIITGDSDGGVVTELFSKAMFSQIIYYLYFTICALYLLFLLIHLIKIILLNVGSEHVYLKTYTLIISDHVQVPFSFMRSIYINGKTDDNEKEYIIKHEYSHIIRGHSLDVVLINLISIFQWFNPFITLFRRFLIETHEYQADKDVLEGGFSIDVYRSLLLSSQFGISPYLSNSFNKSLTLKRFKKMENLNQKRAGFIAVASSLLTLTLLFTVVSLSNAKDSVNKEDLNSAAIAESVFNKGGMSAADTLKYMEVDVKPTFMGGDVNEFTKWVSTNVRYPFEAYKNGVQGRVLLQFTIDKNGKVINVKVSKGAAQLLDEEAVRVVSKSPDWTPGVHKGEKVDVIFYFPVIFQLR